MHSLNIQLNKIRPSFIIHPVRKARTSMFMVLTALSMVIFHGTAAQALDKMQEAEALNTISNFEYSLQNAQTITIPKETPSNTAARDTITVTAAPEPTVEAVRAPVRAAMAPGELDAAQAYASSQVGGGEEWNCLYNLVARESGWRVEAYNASSGSMGLFQALPGKKMQSFGDDYETNPITQINWGLSYISGRYGTPCNAWAHSEAVGWY